VRGERGGREALRASELRYRTVVSGLGEGVIVHDADGVIESGNPAADRHRTRQRPANINRHGGHIWAQAEPDNGASFTFTLKTNGDTR